MTTQEAKAWKEFSAANTTTWRLDPIHSTPADLLMFKGGESGIFAMIVGSTVNVGTYAGALPHIGEAEFKIQGSQRFADNNAAHQFLLERGGVEMLRGYIGL